MNSLRWVYYRGLRRGLSCPPKEEDFIYQYVINMLFYLIYKAHSLNQFLSPPNR